MNQVKNGIIFAILLFLSCVNVSAQVIKGRVTDSTTNEALSYAAVEIPVSYTHLTLPTSIVV